VKYTDAKTGKRNNQPVLLTHRFLNVVCGAFTAPIIWPIAAFKDLTIIECTLRGVVKKITEDSSLLGAYLCGRCI